MNQRLLKSTALSCAEKIKDTDFFYTHPTKHLIVENFLPSFLLNDAIMNFPTTDDGEWDFQNDSDIEVKYRTKWSSEFDIPDKLIDVIRILNSSIILSAISDRLSIQKLIPDPYFCGGGLNVILPGGLLDVHVDGNYNENISLHRRINAILFLNPGWQDSWGGEFCFYDDNAKNCLKKVAPSNNRLFIFDTHDKSFHGHPEPLNFPLGNSRKSIILYYYTSAERDSQNVLKSEPHSALWRNRSFFDKKGIVGIKDELKKAK